jgi:hypothetical protein
MPDPDRAPRPKPRQGRKGRITGIASHLNHVPDTTCHVEAVIAGSGTAIAYITPSSGLPLINRAARKVKGTSQLGIQRKHGFGKAGCQPDTRPLNNKNKTLLHTQASDRWPRENGAYFFYGLKSPEAISAELGRGVHLGGEQKAWLLLARYRGARYGLPLGRARLQQNWGRGAHLSGPQKAWFLPAGYRGARYGLPLGRGRGG